MLLRVAESIRHCLDHAVEARELAATATDDKIKAEYQDMERRWMLLAESYRLVEQMELFIADGKRALPHDN
jgi:hypothetical protein